MIRSAVFLWCLAFATTAFAEARWQKITDKDELTDESRDMAIVFNDEKNLKLASGFCIGFEKGNPKYIGLAVGQLDRILPADLGSNEVTVTYRAKGAPKRTGKWKLFPGNREIHLQPPSKEAALEMISGESLIIQIDHTGKRYTFDLSGPKGDELRKYVKEKFAKAR